MIYSCEIEWKWWVQEKGGRLRAKYAEGGRGLGIEEEIVKRQNSEVVTAAEP